MTLRGGMTIVINGKKRAVENDKVGQEKAAKGFAAIQKEFKLLKLAPRSGRTTTAATRSRQTTP